jgi:hypothetical protein
LKDKSGSAVTRACMRGGIWKTGKSGYLSHMYLLFTRFFRAQNTLASSLTSNHGVPMGNLHSNVLVTKSAFTFTRKIVHPGGLRNTKCASSTSKRLSVWAKHILGSSLMMAHDGHMGQTRYRYVCHGAQLYEHLYTPWTSGSLIDKSSHHLYQSNKKTKAYRTKIGEFYPSWWVNGAVA